LVLGLAGPFIIRAPNGQPYLNYQDFLPSWSSLKSRWNNIEMPGLGDNNSASGDTNSTDKSNASLSNWGKTRVYRWQDEDGIWQYSDTQPADIEAEVLWFDPNENTLFSQPTEIETEESQDEDENNAQKPGFELPLPLTVAPGEVSTLIEDAKKAQELMQQRNEMLESTGGESR